MIEPRILVKGKFSPEDIHISLSKSNRKTTPELEKKIGETWKGMEVYAKETGRMLWDGESYRLNNFEVRGGKLYLDVAKIKFHIRGALSYLAREILDFSEEYASKGLAIAGLVETSDGKFLFGQRSGKTMTHNKIDFIGGIVEDIELTNGKELFELNRREISEELGVKAPNIEGMRIIGLVLSASGNVIIISKTKLNIDSNAVRKTFRDGADEEMSDLIFVEPEELEEFFKSFEGYQSLVANLL